MVECQLVALKTRVRFPSSALFYKKVFKQSNSHNKMKAVKLGKFQIKVSSHKWNPTDRMSSENISYLNNTLDRLGESFRDVEWMVAGGLSIPLSTGTFYRKHEDLDIAIPKSDLSKCALSAQNIGYLLFSRVAMAKTAKSSRIYLYEELNPIKLPTKLKRLKLIKIDERGRIQDHETIDHHIDIWPYEVQEEHIKDVYGRYTFPAEKLKGRIYRTPNGTQVQIQDLKLTHELKVTESNKKSGIDTQKLDVILKAA